MKAIILRAFGSPDALRLETVPDPVPGHGEVLLRTAAVSVNRSFDLLLRQGLYKRGGVLPMVLGADPVGTVAALGEGVADLRVGDRVAAMSTIACGMCPSCRAGAAADCSRSTTLGVHRWGGYAECVAVPARNLARIPDGLSFVDALPVARHASAAFNFLVRRGRLRLEETVVVTGAAGALGHFAVQVAKLAGARVIAVAGSQERCRTALANGADFAIDYAGEDVLEALHRHSAGRGADAVLLTGANRTLFAALQRGTAQGGRMINCGAHGIDSIDLDLRDLYSRRLQIIGAAGTDVSDLDWALEAAAEGRLRPGPTRLFPLEEAAESHRFLESTSFAGKVVLTVDGDQL